MTQTVSELDQLKRINDECESVKVKHKDSNGTEYFTADVRIGSVGRTMMYRWRDQRDWTFSLPRLTDTKPTQRDPLLLSRVVCSETDAPTEKEWNILVDFYLQGKFTEEVVHNLNRDMANPFYFESVVKPSILEIIARNNAQRLQQEKSQSEALARKTMLAVKVDGEGMCSAHLTGFIRDHEKERFLTTFLNPAKGEVYCKKCGTPNAVIIMKPYTDKWKPIQDK